MPEPAAIVATLMGQLKVAITDGPHTAGETDEIISTLLTTLPIMGQQPFPKWDEAVIAPMGDVKNVAQNTLKHLRFHITHPKRDIYRIFRITQSLNLIAHLSNHKPILDALIAQRSLRTIIHALDTLAPLPSHSRSPEYATFCISGACNCISQHFMANDGLGRIIEAFASGVLPVLLRCANLLVSEDEQYTSLICDYLHRFIIYPSVLRVAEKSLDGFVMPELPITPSVTAKMAQTAYTQFTVSMAKVAVVKEYGAGRGQEVCSNTKCHKADSRSALRCCTGCKDTYYCSVSCQKADWNDVHRAYCKEVVNQRNKGLGNPISRKDISFLHSLVETEIYLRVGMLRAACKKHNITKPAVEFDYGKYPFKITISSAESVPDHADAGMYPVSEDANVIITVLYPTGLYSRGMGHKMFIPLDEKSDIPDSDSDLPDILYIVEVKI